MNKWKNMVSAAWLAEALEKEGVKVIDGSWYMPQQNRNAREEYEKGHIPGAVFFDLDAVSDRQSPLPHMLPNEAAFAEAVSALGIKNDDLIVIYDGAGLFSAARAWWTFKIFGHKRVFILQGGMPAWKKINGAMETGWPGITKTRYKARLEPSKVVDWQAVLRMSEDESAQILDARGAERFSGQTPEPRAGLRSGHITGSYNLPFPKLMEENGSLKGQEELRELFKEAGIDLSRPITTTCGSGVTAAILSLALDELGHAANQLYDGSWAEWGAHPQTAHRISVK